MRDGGKGGEEDVGNVKFAGDFLQGNFQLVLLYGREGWVVTGAMLKVLEVFHYWDPDGFWG